MALSFFPISRVLLACLLLLAACCLLLLLLLAKFVRSTLDTKRATMGSKRAKNTCLSTPSGLGTNLEKMILDHFWTHR